MPQGGDCSIHANTDSWDLGEVQKMGSILRVLRVPILCKSLQELEQGLLRDFTPSSSELGEVGESESGIQIVSDGIERPTNGELSGARRRQLQLSRPQILLGNSCRFHG